MKRRTLLVAAAAGLAGCAAAPPPPRRELSAAALLAADPAALRAAVRTDTRVLVQAVAIDLRLPEERFVIRLQQPAPTDAWLTRLDPAPEGQGWQVFAAGAQAATTLVTLRQMLASAGVVEAIAATVSAQPAMVPADLVGRLPMRIDLRLDDRGWFTVVDGRPDLRQ
jgi:hypothetical protein